MSTTEARPLDATPEEPNDVRPMTGEEYLESLRDGREIYIYGERVEDVTTHPAFRNGARSVAQLYDALHDPDADPALRAHSSSAEPSRCPMPWRSTSPAASSPTSVSSRAR